ncbi:MAG: hypothetical protein AAF318_08850 [Pseudomonadota bacterium]
MKAARGALSQHGIAYPPLGGQGLKDQADLRHALTGDRAARARVVAELKALTPSAVRHLILSGETLYHHDPARLRAILCEAGWGDARLSAIAVVRDAPSWLNSGYAFDVSLLQVRARFAPYVVKAMVTGQAARFRCLSRWSRAETLSALPLADRRDARPVVTRALEALCVPPAAAVSRPPRNVALDPRTVEAARRLAADGHARAGVAALYPVRSTLIRTAKTLGFDGRFNGLTPSLCRAIELATRPSRDAFAGAVWGTPWDSVVAEAAGGAPPNEWSARTAAPGEAEAIAELVANVRAAHPPRRWRARGLP